MYCRLICIKPYQIGTGHEYHPGETIDASTRQTAEDLIRSGFFELPAAYKIDLKEILKKEIEQMIYRGEQPEAILKTAEYIIEKHHLKTLNDTEEILFYSEGFYQFGGECLAKKEIESIWETRANNKQVGEVIGHITRRTYVKAEDFLEGLDLICLQNGVLNIRTKELSPHDPKHLTLTKIPVEYDKDAICPEIETFLSNALHPEDIATFYEIAGYCLYKTYEFHKSFLFIGGGGNGKTTAINLLINFLGPDNKTSVPLQTLEADRFAKAQLYGKLANICDDLPNKALYGTGTFKQLTGNSPIDSDRKHKSRINFHNHAKLIFACNEMPEMKDSSEAFFDRWITINFPHKFRNTPREDPGLSEKISRPGELSGFLNKALEGLDRLLVNKKFSTNKSTEENEVIMTRLTNSIKAFVDDCMVSDSTQWLPKEAVYRVYVYYCDRFKVPVKTNTKFTQEIKMYLHFEDCKRGIPGIDGQKLGWNGITFNWELVNDLKVAELSYLAYFFAIVGSSISKESNIEKNNDNPAIPSKISGFGEEAKILYPKNLEKVEKYPDYPSYPVHQEKPRDFKISVLYFLQNFDEGFGVERSELEILGSVDYQLSKEEIFLVLDRLKSDGRIFEVSEGKYKINQ
jgi:P4 family phage/plasmid primase-like protien